MRNGRRLVVTLALLHMMASAAIAFAQDAPPAARDTAAEQCRRTVLRFMEAVNAGDGPTIESLIFAPRSDDAQQKGLRHLARCIELQRALERAAAARWGADGGAAVSGGAMTSFTAADRAAVERAKVDVSGASDTAHLVTGPGVAPIVVRRSRIDGQWRISLRAFLEGMTAMRQGDDVARTRLDHLKGVERALFHVAWLVRQKRVDTPAAARRELDDALKRAAEQKPVEMDDVEKAETVKAGLSD